MNLRSHTYLIPVLCGTAAFAALVASDYSIRRFANGEGYGMASYLVEVATPDAKKPARVAMAAALPPAAPVVAVVRPAPAPVVAEAAAVVEAEAAVGAEAVVGAEAGVDAEAVVAAEESPKAAVAAPDETITAAEPADESEPVEAQMPSPPVDDVVRISSEPGGFAARCSTEKGFKRCRIGD